MMRLTISKTFCRQLCSGNTFRPNELEALSKNLKRLGCEVHLPDAEKSTSKERAVSVMVGWAAASLRSVGKYSTLYTTNGIPCASVAPSMLHVWSTKLANPFVRSVLEGIRSSFDSPVSLVLHMFSVSPGVVLPALCEDYSKVGSPLRINLPLACVLFDSGPADFSYETGTAAARLVYAQGRYNFPTYLAATAVGITTNRLVGSKKREELNRALKSTVLAVPQLYLYSETDTVAQAWRVRQRIEEQVALGRPVSHHCWTGSQHVRHLVEHPAEYHNQVAAFLKQCNILM